MLKNNICNFSYYRTMAEEFKESSISNNIGRTPSLHDPTICIACKKPICTKYCLQVRKFTNQYRLKQQKEQMNHKSYVVTRSITVLDHLIRTKEQELQMIKNERSLAIQQNRLRELENIYKLLS